MQSDLINVIFAPASQCKTSAHQGCWQWFRSLLSIGGDNLQFYPNFALFSTLGEMKLEHDFFSCKQIKGRQKKQTKVFSKN